MKNEFLSKISDQQDFIIKNLLIATEAEPEPKATREIRKLKNVPENSFLHLGGSLFASRMKNFLNNVDPTHPHLDNICYGFFADPVWVQNLLYATELFDWFAEKNVGFFLKSLDSIRSSLLDWNTILEQVSSIFNNRYLRLIQNDSVRNKARNNLKSVQNLFFGAYTSEVSAFGVYPNNFSEYARHIDPNQKMIDLYKRRQEVFSKAGMEHSVNVSSKQLNFIKEKDQKYLGFNRVSMIQCALILAKMHDWEMDSNNKLIKNNAICEPSIYGLKEFTNIPDRVKKSLRLVESMPEVGDKPIFDNFSVVVTGIKQGDLQKKTENDKILVDKQDIIPVLIGEKDDKAYFICYWI